MNIAQVRRYALSLPEVTEEPHFEYSSFRVRGKIFVTVPPDGKHVHIFVGDDEREVAGELHSSFVEPLIWGGKARGLRVNLSNATPSVLNRLVLAAWVRKAPKKLTAQVLAADEERVRRTQ
jgi:hypothetical protein